METVPDDESRRLYRRTASELAALIAAREVSSRGVVEAHLARIDEVNDYVNAVTVVLADSALQAADEADRGERRGPLFGVPFTIKENIDCLGSATTHGLPAMATAMPLSDAPVVSRMKAAGAIPLARTNLPELGLRLSTDNPLHGRTRNPWSSQLTAGGSSGGEAVALATGMTPFGLGNDIGGSLRSPAYCCGVAALKPTAGRVPRAASLEPLDSGMAVQAMLVEGPMARSVADLRLGLSLLAGRDLRDPRSIDAPLEGPEPAVRRAALVTRVPGVGIPAVTVAEIKRAGEILNDAGWVVEEAEPPELELVAETWGYLIATDFSVWVPAIQPLISGRLYQHLMRICRRFDPRDLANSEVHARRSRLTRLWSAFLARYPVMIAPTWTQLPWPPDADLEPATGLKLLLDTVQLILPGNLLGLPSVALPTGVVDGLPTGIQIYADLWREDLCLAAAEIIEERVEAATPIDPAG